MREIERAQNITKSIYQEYKKLYSEYVTTNVKPDFSELEKLLFLEQKFYSLFSIYELEKLKEDLTKRKNVPEGIQFFDFFYCFEQEDQFLNYRIRSMSNLELAKREFGEDFPRQQVAYFPLCIDVIEDYMIGVYNDYQIMHSLLLHNFLNLISENEHLSKIDKEKVKFLSSYMFPHYERYFLKNLERDISDFSEIYQGEKNFMTYAGEDLEDDDLEEDWGEYSVESLQQDLFLFFSSYYDAYVLKENCLFVEAGYIPNAKAFTRFIYLSCYVRAFFELCEGVPVLEDNPFFKLRKCEVEDRYKEEIEKYHKKILKR